MPDYTGSYGEVVSRGIKTLTSTTNIRQVIPGSKARALIETHAKEVDNLSILQSTNLKKAFLSTTFGQFLEHYGATVGEERYAQRNAEVLDSDRVLRFYVRGGGTFGSINNGSGITIDEGTRMTAPSEIVYESSSLYGYQDQPDTIFDRSIHYTVTEAASAAASDTQLFISGRALTPGAGGNLAAPKMIKTHTFTNYTDYLGKSLLVENVKPILNGVDEESESSYKYRISKKITAAEKANSTAIVNAALGVPGVADVVIVPWEDGAGRFNVYVKAISSIVSDKVISDVQTAMDLVTAVGNIGYARKPYEIGIEIDSTVTFKAEYQESVKTEAKNNLATVAIRYLNSMDLGQPLSLSSLATILKQADSRVSTVGFNGTTFFDSVFIWYPAKLADGGRRRERLITDTFSIPLHARIIAETSISDPIRLV